jgi:hypothetical protein
MSPSSEVVFFLAAFFSSALGAAAGAAEAAAGAAAAGAAAAGAIVHQLSGKDWKEKRKGRIMYLQSDKLCIRKREQSEQERNKKIFQCNETNQSRCWRSSCRCSVPRGPWRRDRARRAQSLCEY